MQPSTPVAWRANSPNLLYIYLAYNIHIAGTIYSQPNGVTSKAFHRLDLGPLLRPLVYLHPGPGSARILPEPSGTTQRQRRALR